MGFGEGDEISQLIKTATNVYYYFNIICAGLCIVYSTIVASADI